MRCRGALFGALLCLAELGRPAGANGRFPASVNVRFQPDETQTILAPATFGLLISHDDGATFHWVCEAGVGYAGVYDPDYAVATDGAIYATTFDGLRVSRDGGCTFQAIGAPLDAEKYVSE